MSQVRVGPPLEIHPGALRRFAGVAFGAALLAAGSCNDWPQQATAGFRTLTVQVVADGLDHPVYVAAPAGDPRLFIVQRNGIIRVLSGGRLLTQPFLDRSADVSMFGNERGMLSLAFHPQFAVNGRLFVTYTGRDGAIHLDEHRVSSTSPDVADAASRKPILEVPAPGVQHYGGMLQFTPEGALMVSVGEGGTFNEPGGESQNPGSLLGKLLRIDVDAGSPYAVPANNPYVAQPNARPEIWAMGLRNPWRFSIDATTRQLYVADVGDNTFEEVNIVPLDSAGLNYGWNYFEGPNCRFTADLCTAGNYHLPELDYTHQPPCSSVTGGFVYRGTEHPEHKGRYFYADYCLGWIRSVRFEGGRILEEIDWATSIPTNHIASFGEDGARALYAVSLDGRVYKIGADKK